MEGIWMTAAFYLLAATILGSALLVVMLRNIVHSVLWLAVCFVAMAGLFLTLDADFLAAVQVLVYAGAVCIMVVFGIMLIQRGDMGSTNLFNSQTKAAAGVVALVLVVCGYLAATTPWVSPAVAVPEKTVENIAEIMLSKYVIPFEVAAILLLVALVGAIFLAKEVKADAHND
ncbi:NADH-quinone oxidoreductase subunit J [Desulfofundulus luciae]|uniref:NADH-quinone oxidoreductase subunit J n=1 Tax=Desulfofundulus luciae TaxID=74702 RepID=A0ABU0B4D3_9FIRM|nr:NADH-quinone oxidoreductase subunit J [Desulfofundulus luciae]MDQ0287576.1 NADH-quinone oxidoreductase subunit J [Desulfofundulus luciae]